MDHRARAADAKAPYLLRRDFTAEAPNRKSVGDITLGSVGSSADNALAEAFNATLKGETLAGAAVFLDEAPCRREIFRWAVRYNTRRRHSYCGATVPEHLAPPGRLRLPAPYRAQVAARG